jgi:hypothetical protein
LLAPLLWPAIPLAVVGFWPAEPARAEVGKLDTLAAPAPRKPRRGPRRR